MKKHFSKFFEQMKHYTNLEEKAESYIAENVQVKEYSKHEMIFTEGVVSKTIYFLVEGAVRLFYNADGIDKTAYFYSDGKFICAGESFTYDVPAVENYQAMEDNTVIMHFHKETIEKLMALDPAFELIARVAVEDELIHCQKMLASFITKSPEQRYIDLLENQSDLFLRVPQQYIASYLGVSPETLSRIKKRVSLKSRK